MRPIIAISPKYTIDSIRIMHLANADLPYQLVRFQSWDIPNEYRNDVVAAYGEDLFVEYVAEQCNLELLQTSEGWLVTVPNEFLKRKSVTIRNP